MRQKKAGRTEPLSKTTWRRIFRNLVEGYMMNPSEFGNLTLYQVRALTCPETDLGGTQKRNSKDLD